jgi:DNA polymerase III gamma/tau subunit
MTPAQLTDRYRPQSIAEFVGLEKPKRIFASFARHPHKASFLFVGPSGTGKTTFARALAQEINAELLHIRSQECSIDRLRETLRYCGHLPMTGRQFWLVLIDEVDTASQAALNWLLTTLDELPENTVFVFSAAFRKHGT